MEDSEEIFFFQKLQEEFPKIFSLSSFDDLPYDEQNVRYSNWKDVYNNMLEREKDKFFKNLPRDIFNLLILSIPFEEILDFLNKICSHNPNYCDQNQDFWPLLWKRDINNYPPHFQNVKEKYLAFANEFNKETNIYGKLNIAARFGAINQPIFISKFNEETDIQKKFYLAVQYGAIDLINNLINQGADISAGNYEVFHIAAGYDHLKVLYFLMDLDPEGIKANNYEALLWAAARGNLEIVRILANLGPEGIKAKNYAPLRSAAYYGHLEVVHFLVDLDPEGIKAKNYEALYSAALGGHLEVVRFLANLDPEGIAKNYNPLRSAAEEGHLEVVHLLADLGPEGIKANNYKALRMAAENGHLEVVRFLLSKIENLSEIPNDIKILIRDKFNILI